MRKLQTQQKKEKKKAVNRIFLSSTAYKNCCIKIQNSTFPMLPCTKQAKEACTISILKLSKVKNEGKA